MKTQLKTKRATARNFYDRKVRQEGNSRVVSLTKLIPKTWKYVRLTTRKTSETRIILCIEKLYEEEKNNGKHTKNKTPHT